MRAMAAAVVGFFLASSGTTASAATVFSYRGRMLVAQTGNGVPGVRHLRFKLSGDMPAKGACSKNLAVLAVSDGAYSLKKLLSLGFGVAPGSKAEVCSDATTGALSEKLRVQLVVESDGDLVASYTWESFDPQRGKAADSVTLFANVEYHVSVAKVAGRLRAD